MFISSPRSPSKSHTKPRNWPETFEALISSDIQEDFVFQKERGSRQHPAPSQGHHQGLSKQETWLHSLHPVPRSSTSQVLLLLTIFHQRMLSCVLTSFLKTTGGIQAEGLVQGEPLRSPSPLKPEALS